MRSKTGRGIAALPRAFRRLARVRVKKLTSHLGGGGSWLRKIIWQKHVARLADSLHREESSFRAGPPDDISHIPRPIPCRASRNSFCLGTYCWRGVRPAGLFPLPGRGEILRVQPQIHQPALAPIPAGQKILAPRFHHFCFQPHDAWLPSRRSAGEMPGCSPKRFAAGG